MDLLIYLFISAALQVWLGDRDEAEGQARVTSGAFHALVRSLLAKWSIALLVLVRQARSLSRPN